MRTIILSSILFILIGCSSKENIYTSSDKTINLSTVRNSDKTNSSISGMQNPKEREFDKIFPKNNCALPDSLKDVKYYYSAVDLNQALFQAYKGQRISKSYYERFVRLRKIDSLNYTDEYLNVFLFAATGTSESGTKYYIVDTNGDKELMDEKVYQLEKYVKGKQTIIHRFEYETFRNNLKSKSYSWVSFYDMRETLCKNFKESASATFIFDSLHYEIKVTPSSSSQYDKSSIARLMSQQDTLLFRNGQYLNLGSNYYKLDFTINGDSIKLEKIENAINKGGTQKDFTPLKFKARDINGEIVNFPSDFKGKYILLDFWSIHCSPCIDEINNHYFDTYSKYKDVFEIVAIGRDRKSSLKQFVKNNDIQWVNIGDETKRLQNLYGIRGYPTLFLINPNGKIVLTSTDKEIRNCGFEDLLIKEIQRKNAP